MKTRDYDFAPWSYDFICNLYISIFYFNEVSEHKYEKACEQIVLKTLGCLFSADELKRFATSKTWNK